jgi:hypothetical protein
MSIATIFWTIRRAVGMVFCQAGLADAVPTIIRLYLGAIDGAV